MTKHDESPPTVALLTPRGRGAVATVRLCGDLSPIGLQENSLFRAANGKPLVSQTLGQIVFGRWGTEPAEEVVLCRRDNSTLEIHCHGGDTAVRRILDDLQAAGCELASWRDQERELSDLVTVECAEVLSRAPTLRTASILLDQSSGTLREAFTKLKSLQQDCQVLRAHLDDLLRWAEFGLHLTHSWRVVLCGRPNVGKSSLINALVGYGRSIVFDEPGTTRDIVTVETAFAGWPMELIDTAGLRDEAGGIEAAGIERARAAIVEGDCTVVVIDTSIPPTEQDDALLDHLVRQRTLHDTRPVIIVAHKSDLPNVWGDHLPAGAIIASSINGAGIDALAAEIVSRLVPQVPQPGIAVPVTLRQIELLRQARRVVDQNDHDALQNCVANLWNRL